VVTPPTYRPHDHAGDDLGLLSGILLPHVEPTDVAVLPDPRDVLAMARVETEPGPLAALLEVAGHKRVSADCRYAALSRP